MIEVIVFWLAFLGGVSSAWLGFVVSEEAREAKHGVIGWFMMILGVAAVLVSLWASWTGQSFHGHVNGWPG